MQDQDIPKRKFHTSPQVQRVIVLDKDDFGVVSDGGLVGLKCRIGSDSVKLSVDPACAAWLSVRLRLHAMRAGRIAGGPGAQMVKATILDVVKKGTVKIPKSMDGSGQLMQKTEWNVKHEGEVVALFCQQGPNVLRLPMEAPTAAWLSAELRLAAKHSRSIMGYSGISTTTGILSSAEHDYKYGLDKD